MTGKTVTPKQTSALHEILTWSANRPEWQRDALRRIVEKGILDSTDISELERICRRKITIEAIKPIPMLPEPLIAAHLPSAPGASESVALISMGDIQYVNRLPHGSTLPFGVGTGLTIVYGENGAGKTSYARVIKKACRARGEAPNIMSNALEPMTATPASATIAFKVGSADVQSLWTNGVTADPRLANVFVFDAFSAEHYVRVHDAAAFTPYGLDVLPALSKVCDELAARLKTDIDQWNAKLSGASANWKYDATTQVGKLIQNLTTATKESEIAVLAGLNQTDSQRLVVLREALKADPLQKAKETRAAITRLKSFATRVGTAATSLADDGVEQIRKQLEDATTATMAAKAFAAGQFDTAYLAGTGSDMWRKLWNAARQYSASGPYPSGEYPAVSQDAQCVLCQQELDDAARLRFSRFDAFCEDKSQQLAEEAERLLSDTITRLKSDSALKPELEKVNADIAILTAEQVAALADFVAKADARLLQVKQSLDARTWTASAGVPVSPEASIRETMKSLEQRAKTEESANDPNARKVLEAERQELEAREWLSGVKTDVLKQIERCKTISELKQCDKDLKTTPITAKSSELTKLFVTKAFQDRFNEETKLLGLTTLNVVMEPVQGKKGVINFGLRLVNAVTGKVVDIASEGEKRCVALAAFLSELSQASHQSALVFDDPVSSLDHRHREKIATRLAAEAGTRQVIVFTHDVVFLNDLIAFSEERKLTPNVLTLEWDNDAPGKYIQGLPWDSKKPNECLTALDERQKIIAGQWNLQPNAANIESMRHAYSLLRSTMEKIVEYELLDGIVRRFESQMNTGRVKNLIGITQQEADKTKCLFQKCHDLTDAHASTMAAIPTPTELKQDILDARQLVATIRSRKSVKQKSAGGS